MDGVNQPLISYDSTTGVFTANSDDESLIDTFGTFSLDVTFANYSPDVAAYTGVTTASSSGQFEFIDPCLDPFEFNAVTQSPLPTDADYKFQSSEFTVSDFNIKPERCEQFLIYEVTSVTLPGQSTDVLNSLEFIDTGEGFSFFPTEDQYQDGTFPPGTYDVVIKGTSTLSGDEDEVTV